MRFIAENLDKGIAPLVELLNDNDFRPFASCDGEVLHHPDKYGNYDPYDIINAYVSMLDSENTRNLFAVLMDNDRYNLHISMPADYMLYGNHISGLRYAIYFDNHRGGCVDELIEITKKVISGEIIAKPKNRKKIDSIAFLLSSEFISENLDISFEFHGVYRGVNDKSVGENYLISANELELKKDMYSLVHAIGLNEESPELNTVENGMLELYLNDIDNAIEYLHSIIMLYHNLNEYKQHEETWGQSYISKGIEKHVKNMQSYIDELYNRQVAKAIHRHYRKLRNLGTG